MSPNSSEVLEQCAVLRAIVGKVSAMLAYWDADQRCRFANEAYQRWFGVSPEALIGKHISELLGPLYELNRPYIEGALRGEPQEFERVIPDPAGGPPRHSLAQYVPDVADNLVRGFFVLVSDVSGLKRAEMALRESEERFRLTIDEAPIGMALLAPDGRFLRVNRALCDLVGYSAEELTQLTFQAITHPDDLDADLALAAKLASGEISRYSLAKRYFRKDRTVVDAMLHGSVLRDPGGAPIHYIAQIEDITERKRLEREQRFLADIGPILAANLDFDQTLTRIADLAVRDIADLCIVESVEDGDDVRRIKVASRDPARAWVCDVLTAIPLDRRRPHLMYPVLETRRPFLLQQPSRETIASFAQSDEHYRALVAAEIQSMVAIPLIANDRLLGVIALLSSSRVYGPADVALAEELARRASLSIENARLYRAARRATHARDDVLGIVAHDLRNPLNTILLSATMLEGGTDQESTSRAARVIERSARRMNRLIQDLLDVTRVDAGKLSLVSDRVALRQILRDAVDGQAQLAAATFVELRLEAADQLPDVWADHDRLYQVFENLIGNALKFTRPGGVITLTATPRDSDVVFCVRDTGVGIPEEHLPHLFDRFWQAGTGERHGAGLGLPIVKGIVDAHGGTLWVESTVGAGSAFYFTIPTARSEAARAAS